MPLLGSNEDALRSLKARIDALDKVATRAMSTATNSTVTSAKRFRIAIVSIPLTLLGSSVSASVKWSTPITDQTGTLVDQYNVDASCSAMPTTPLNFTITNQTSEGVTVTFQAPVLLAANTMIVVLGIAPLAPAS